MRLTTSPAVATAAVEARGAPRSRRRPNVASLLLLLLLPAVCLLFLALAPAAVEAAVPSGPHSMFSWDYSPQLGGKTWWPTWYPSCALPYQAPATIDWTTIADSTDTLVIETVSGRPLAVADVIVAYNSTFNSVQCDVSSGAEKMYIYWKPAAGQVADKGPLFTQEKINFFFPSQNPYQGALATAEIAVTFTSTARFPLTSTTVMDNLITDDTTVVVSILLTEVQDSLGRPDVELLLQGIMSGYDTGVTRLAPFLPVFSKVVQYKGTVTTPPCRGNAQHFVTATPLPLETSTLKKFKQYGPNWPDYRTPAPADNRPVRYVGFEAPTLLAALNPDASIGEYAVYNDRAAFRVEEKRLALTFGFVMAAALSGVLLCVLVVQLISRFTHKVPFSLTWRLPGRSREVFGVALRHGEETGRPKPVPTMSSYFSAPAQEEAGEGDAAEGAEQEEAGDSGDIASFPEKETMPQEKQPQAAAKHSGDGTTDSTSGTVLSALVPPEKK